MRERVGRLRDSRPEGERTPSAGVPPSVWSGSGSSVLSAQIGDLLPRRRRVVQASACCGVRGLLVLDRADCQPALPRAPCSWTREPCPPGTPGGGREFSGREFLQGRRQIV